MFNILKAMYKPMFNILKVIQYMVEIEEEVTMSCIGTHFRFPIDKMFLKHVRRQPKKHSS